MAKKGYAWVFTPEVAKLSKKEKEEIVTRVNKHIEESSKLKGKVCRIEVKAGRIYFYELVEQYIPEGCILMKPLIDGKYFEFPCGRITLYDKNGDKSTADWQRHNNQWMTLFEGNLEDCIKHMNQPDSWF
jgi:hypothetical protein